VLHLSKTFRNNWGSELLCYENSVAHKLVLKLSKCLHYIDHLSSILFHFIIFHILFVLDKCSRKEAVIRMFVKFNLTELGYGRPREDFESLIATPRCVVFPVQTSLTPGPNG
jgi:hypothetical protein